METSHKSKSITPFVLFFFLLLSSVLLYLFGETWLRKTLLYLSTATWARNLVSSLPIAQPVARRFVAGESRAESLAAARELNARGMLVTMDYLGESVTSTDEAIDARDEILHLLDAIYAEDLNANVSVKLSQLGLKLDENLAFDNVYLLLERAQQYNNKIRIDMEESSVVDVTLEIYRTLRDRYGMKNVGVVLQAYLYRTEADVNQLIDEGAWIRLCKGAYMEPPEVAFAQKEQTDENYVKLMRMLLSEKARDKHVYVGIATHDEAMIAATKDYVNTNSVPLDAFEFQMLYGVRREIQETLVAEGYRVRIYTPYGQAWYPYFVRRLAERPANLWFFISNFFKK
ncbi:MAG: proline dehydrogenase family protein [Anaerolineales bacterium]|nr:proline dehydrogenase family protein [Anaerolineales bacterium]